MQIVLWAGFSTILHRFSRLFPVEKLKTLFKLWRVGEKTHGLSQKINIWNCNISETSIVL